MTIPIFLVLIHRTNLLTISNLNLFLSNQILKINFPRPPNGILQAELLTILVIYLSYNIPIWYIEGKETDKFCQYLSLG